MLPVSSWMPRGCDCCPCQQSTTSSARFRATDAPERPSASTRRLHLHLIATAPAVADAAASRRTVVRARHHHLGAVRSRDADVRGIAASWRGEIFIEKRTRRRRTKSFYISYRGFFTPTRPPGARRDPGPRTSSRSHQHIIQMLVHDQCIFAPPTAHHTPQRVERSDQIENTEATCDPHRPKGFVMAVQGHGEHPAAASG
eukprot:scaffold24199_cov62-Phaeocystis_antarctica.AAC.1